MKQKDNESKSKPKISKEDVSVIELKEDLISNNAVWGEDFGLLDQFIDDGVLAESSKSSILKNKGQPLKMKAMMEEVREMGRAGDLDKIASIFEATNTEANRWIADEIWHEMSLTKPKVKYDDYIDFEAKYIIHREFGHEKRLSEMEKRILSKMVMDRTQCQKNIHMKYIQRIRQDGDIQLLEAETKEKDARAMALRLESFIKENMGKLNTKVKDPAGLSTSGLFVDVPPFEHLNKEIDGTISMFSSSMLAKESLQLEKSRTMAKVNIEEKPDTKLHEELEDAIRRYAQKLVDAQKAAMQVEKDILQMEQDLIDIEHEHERAWKGKNKIIRLLQKEVDHYQSKIDELEPTLFHYRAIVGEVRQEIYDWKERKDELSKGKRLTEICTKKVDKTTETLVHKMLDDDVEVDSDSDGLVQDDLAIELRKRKHGPKGKSLLDSPALSAKNGTPTSSTPRSSGGSAGSSRSGSGKEGPEKSKVTFASPKSVNGQAPRKAKSAKLKSAGTRRITPTK